MNTKKECSHRLNRLVTSLLIFCAVLLVLSSLSTWLYLTAPPPSSIQTARGLASVSIANHFFDMINESIRTGDFDLITQVTSTELIDHPAGIEMTTGLDRLIHSITTIRASAPHFRLLVDSAIPSEDGKTVTLRVHTVGSRGATLLGSPIPLELTSWGWGPIELLRIENGKVAERWGSGEGGVSLDQFDLVAMPPTAPTQSRQIAMIRLRFDPNADLEISNGLATRIMWVENGLVTISYPDDQDSTVGYPQHTIPVDTPAKKDKKSPVVLGTGASLVTLPGEHLTLQNGDESPATILLVVRFGVSSANASNDEVNTMIAEELDRLTQHRPAGVDAQLLANSTMPSNAAEQTYALGRVNIDAGHSITWSRIDQPMLIAVAKGDLGLFLFDGSSCLHQGDLEIQIVNPNSRALSETDCAVVWRDEGGGSVSLLVLTMT